MIDNTSLTQLLESTPKIPNQHIQADWLASHHIELYIKRDDLLHAEISGNKLRKLKYNLFAAMQQNKNTLLTFGGAYSNHIAATAAAAKLTGFKSIGVIRGQELADKPLNPTLQTAVDNGMQLEFVTRHQYRHYTQHQDYDTLTRQYADTYILPEGGSNTLAVKGCTEILNTNDADFDYIAVAVGTAGTMAGLVRSCHPHQHVLGFPAFASPDYSCISNDLKHLVAAGETLNQNNCLLKQTRLITDYHFGGYAKTNKDLINFINQFVIRHDILLDPIYTAKLLFGLKDLICLGYFPKKSKILAIHTGGLQGIAGVQHRLQQTNQPYQIDFVKD